MSTATKRKRWDSNGMSTTFLQWGALGDNAEKAGRNGAVMAMEVRWKSVENLFIKIDGVK